LNKNNGTVNRIVNGVLLKEPLLDVNVANKRERGMLGIATTISSTANDNKNGDTRYVFLYYTESEKRDGSDKCFETYYCEPGTYPIGNHLYRYELNGNELVNPKLLIHLPASPAPTHNGGVIKIGPDNNLYVTIGDLVGSSNESSRTKAQNYKNGTEPDGRAGILRLTQDGKPVSEGIIGKKFPLNLYYAYGIRNSFGIDFDPVSGELWDTENGPDVYDEINIVKPGFNSGWIQVMGPISRNTGITEGQLVNFPGSHYADPVFSWRNPVAVTDIEFMKSSKLGANYQNNIFVGDNNNGNLYFFKVNKDRTGIDLEYSNQQSAGLSDLVVDNNEELSAITFGTGFGSITDIKTGPDGFLYALSFDDGSIYKISPLQ